MAKTISRKLRNAETRQETGSPKTVKVIDLSVPALSVEDAGDDEDLLKEIQAKQAVTNEVTYEKGEFFWLQIPGIYLYNMPLEWEINMKYKDETVKIIGSHKEIRQFANTSNEPSEGNFNAVFEAAASSLESGSRINQPGEAV